MTMEFFSFHSLMSPSLPSVYQSPLSLRTKQNKKGSVLVHSGCYNRTPQTRQLINDINLFLTVLEVGMCKTKELAGLVSRETASWFIDGVSQLCIPIWQKGERGLSGVPLIGALMSFMKPHPHELISSKRSFSQNCHIGGQVSTHGFYGTQTLESIADSVILCSINSYYISYLLLLNFQTVASTCIVSTSSLLALSSTSCNLISLSLVC